MLQMCCWKFSPVNVDLCDRYRLSSVQGGLKSQQFYLLSATHPPLHCSAKILWIIASIKKKDNCIVGAMFPPTSFLDINCNVKTLTCKQDCLGR